jgi:hypothetical protein
MVAGRWRSGIPNEGYSQTFKLFLTEYQGYRNEHFAQACPSMRHHLRPDSSANGRVR